MAVVHLARFGARSGEHALLAHTGAARELLDEAVWRTDVPPQGDADTMGTFVTGYRLDDHYVVQRTTPDPTAERSGMVTTTSVFLPISLVGSVALEPLFAVIDSGPEIADGPVDATLFRDAPDHEHPAGAAALASALLMRRRAVWTGTSGLPEAVACLWRHLPPSERPRLTFGAAFHPDAVTLPAGERDLLVIAVPAPALGRWSTWALVETATPPAPDRVRDAFFGTDDGTARALGVELLGRDVRFEEWRRLVTITDMARNLDLLDHERLRSMLQLLGLVAPARTAGTALKTRVLEALAALTPTAGFDDVRGLRGVPWDALPPSILDDLLARWSAAVVGAELRPGDLAAAVGEITSGAEDAFRDTLDATLRKTITGAGASALLPEVAAVVLDCGDAVEWLVASMKPADVDRHLAAAAAVARSSPKWLAPLARSHRLPLTHATSVDTADPVIAWRAHISMPRRPAASDALLDRRIGDAGTVSAALLLDDTTLASLAADHVVARPQLLKPVDLRSEQFRGLWCEAIIRGADPWAVTTAREARDQLLDSVLVDEDVPPPLLEALAQTSAADISDHPRRAEVWRRLPPSAKTPMLTTTANALGRRLRPGDPRPEAELVEAMLQPNLLGALAHDDTAQAVHLLAVLDCRPEHAVIVAARGRFDAQTARALADIVLSHRWKRAAESIVDLAGGRPDLNYAASKVSRLFSTIERLRRLAGITDGVRGIATHGELRDALHDLAATLYSAGPSDRSIWERAGGLPADCPDGTTPRHRWGLALDAIEEQRAGTPALTDLLRVMRDDYPHSEDLKTLTDTFSKEQA